MMFLLLKPDGRNRFNWKTHAGRSTEVGRAGDGIPIAHLLAQSREALFDKLLGVRAQQQVRGWITYVDDAKECLGCFGRIACLAPAVFLPTLAHRIEHRLVICDRASVADHRASGPFRAK